MAIRRLIVANRGEIAVRIFRTCARLGIESVAVVAPRRPRRATRTIAGQDDRDRRRISTLPSTFAPRSRPGPTPSIPGYGFLAENADFAEDVIAAGLTWVGPSPAALRLGGDKLAAKRIAREAGVPTAAAGLGRRDRLSRSSSRRPPAAAAAACASSARPPSSTRRWRPPQREAEAAFGDGTVFCERYLERPRHVEAQLLGHRGGVAVLGARDCSVQRRHQKLVEESPAPGLDPAPGRGSRPPRVAFAEAIGYQSAGTAEFLVDGPDVYFLELNGRIQVEHPVTEEVTGLDIVELQLRVAAGERSSSTSRPRGHAIEARLYAEDPRTFLPQAGAIQPARAARRRSASTPASRRATRSGSRTTR